MPVTMIAKRLGSCLYCPSVIRPSERIALDTELRIWVHERCWWRVEETLAECNDDTPDWLVEARRRRDEQRAAQQARIMASYTGKARRSW